MNNYEEIYSNEKLKNILSELLNAFVSELFLDKKLRINFENIKYAGWLASILAESPSEDHQRRAQLFAILIHFYGKENPSFDKLSYVILSRLGNLVASKFLLNIFNNKEPLTNNFVYNFGDLLNIELYKDRIKRIVLNGDEELLTTGFQLDLWESLLKDNNLSISAPTSAGKSFIIQKYLSSQCKKQNIKQCLYIVPSKALINQVSEDLRIILPFMDIKTSFIEEEKIEDVDGLKLQSNMDYKNIIFVLTPERCLKLLQNSQRISFYPDIVFVDEIQNVEDIHGRGILFEYVLEQISTIYSRSKIITAGPFIKNGHVLFNDIFNLENINCETKLSPVMQLKTIVRNTTSDNNLELYVNESNFSNNLKLTIPADFDLNFELKKNKGVSIAKTIKLLSKEGQQNIVYCSQPNHVENWSLKLEEQIDKDITPSDSLNELIDFLTLEIHQKYYLIKCLKKKIGFHHSKLPDIVRKEIEDLFKQGDIETLYCTSTLLQGVNLPANNLYITSPLKRNISLSPFEFGNLIGRAGRIKDSLYGIIYCIEGNDEEKHWAEDFYSSNYEKEITTASSKSIENSDSILENLGNTSVEIRDDSISYAITIFRQKYLKSPELFEKYLTKKGINPGLIENIIDGVAQSLGGITLDSNTISLNPTIDPLLQNKLYLKITEDGIENWVFHPRNKNFNRKIGADYLDQYTYEDYSFYWQLATICEKLDDIFNVSKEAYFKHSISLSIKSIAYYSFRWTQNRSLKEIILDDLDFHANKKKVIDINNDEDVNVRINEVININTKIVTFLMVKYFKLLSDILESMMSEEEKEAYRFTLSLPVMLELGTTEPIVIQLISSGITRSVALRIFSEFKLIPNYKDMDVFTWIKKESNLRGIDKIFIRYLKKLKYINEI